jgi:phosphoserine phosphatase
MTSYVLTLIGNAESAPLEPMHIDRVLQCLELPAETDWLAEREACDLFINSSLSPESINEKARDVLAGKSIDTVCTLAEGRRKKLLISDMDSTIIHQECIDELADAIGIGPQIREITATVIRGDISFPEALRKRIGLMKGMDIKTLESVYEQRITLKPGARMLVQTMRQHGAYCILVSGGFTYFTSRIAARLGFHDHQGNELIFDQGKLTGKAQDQILGRSAKLDTLMALCDEKNLSPSEVLAVGDGANDMKMIQAAGLGVAFHDHSGSLRDQANARIEHGDLTALLYIQGFRQSEFRGHNT